MVEGHVHELHLCGVKNAAGKQILHPVAYYTLWAISVAVVQK